MLMICTEVVSAWFHFLIEWILYLSVSLMTDIHLIPMEILPSGNIGLSTFCGYLEMIPLLFSFFLIMGSVDSSASSFARFLST